MALFHTRVAVPLGVEIALAASQDAPIGVRATRTRPSPGNTLAFDEIYTRMG